MPSDTQPLVRKANTGALRRVCGVFYDVLDDDDDDGWQRSVVVSTLASIIIQC